MRTGIRYDWDMICLVFWYTDDRDTLIRWTRFDTSLKWDQIPNPCMPLTAIIPHKHPTITSELQGDWKRPRCFNEFLPTLSNPLFPRRGGLRSNSNSFFHFSAIAMKHNYEGIRPRVAGLWKLNRLENNKAVASIYLSKKEGVIWHSQ